MWVFSARRGREGVAEDREERAGRRGRSPESALRSAAAAGQRPARARTRAGARGDLPYTPQAWGTVWPFWAMSGTIKGIVR
jgi:hypothetical protein